MALKKYIASWLIFNFLAMQIPQGKKIYFLSDFHLGVPDHASSLVREKKVIQFLDIAKQDAEQIFIVGDLFDFWFEYKKVVPKGFVRILGKMAEITDSGIPIDFVGNHDMWMNGYFEQNSISRLP
jgi:UDP-2,3-diacylglucosamine hydrolase